jgi:hypothetical protein
MVRAVMMTPSQISELVALARADAALWEALKDRELEGERIRADAAKQGRQVDDRDLIIDPPPKLPTMGMLLRDLVKQRYGPDHHFDAGGLIMPIRTEVRRDLQLDID